MNPARNSLILAAPAAGPMANTTPRWQRWLLASAAALSLAACGGGGGIAGSGTATDGNSGTTVAGGGPTAGGGAATTPGGGGTTTPGGGNTVGTDLSYGGITAFGSVWVNGVRFNTDSASIRLDDSAVTQSQLRVGMVVRVEGSISGATANTLVVEDALKGYVESVLDANHYVVMGQTVQHDASTSFDNGVRPVQGDLVEVHGIAVSGGVIGASYIEKKTALSAVPFAAKGFAANHNPTAKTFTIGSLTVNYAGATVSDLSAASWNGLYVEAKGSNCAARPVCGTLSASKVEPAGLRSSSSASSSSSSSSRQAEVEGYVSNPSASGFTVAGQAVTVSASTRYEGGVFSDITVGTKLEAEGSLSNGVLNASKVSFRDSARLEGDIASVNTTTRTLTLTGLPGVTVSANSLTKYDKVSGLSGLAVGQHVRIRGRAIGSSTALQATELEVRSSNKTAYIQGPVSAFTQNSVTILGITVNFGGFSDSSFMRSVGSSSSDVVIGRSAFLAALKTGTVVKVKGDLSGSSVAWDEIELEND